MSLLLAGGSAPAAAPFVPSVYPDYLPRAARAAAIVLIATTGAFGPVVPETKAPEADAFFPDRVLRNNEPAYEQQTIAQSLFERTSPAADAFVPDTRNLSPPRASPRSEVFLAPFQPAAPALVVVIPPIAPDRFEAPSAQQPTLDESTEPISDRTSPAAAAFFPDRLVSAPARRFALLDESTEPISDRTSPAAAAFFPDRLLPSPARRFALLDESTEPILDRSSTFFDALYPDRLALVRVVEGTTVFPIEHFPPLPAPVFSDVVFPDAVSSRSRAPATAIIPVYPERANPFFDALYPDRLVLPQLLTAEQQDVAIGIAPLLPIELDADLLGDSSLTADLDLLAPLPAPVPIVSTGGGGGGGGLVFDSPTAFPTRPCNPEIEDCPPKRLTKAQRDARKALRKLAGWMHPDALEHTDMPPEAKDAIEERLKDVTAAFEALRSWNDDLDGLALPTKSSAHDDEWADFMRRATETPLGVDAIVLADEEATPVENRAPKSIFFDPQPTIGLSFDLTPPMPTVPPSPPQTPAVAPPPPAEAPARRFWVGIALFALLWWMTEPEATEDHDTSSP